MAKGKKKRAGDSAPQQREPDTSPNWSGKCIVCGESPTVSCTEMCGPCTFGEAETAGGNW